MGREKFFVSVMQKKKEIMKGVEIEQCLCTLFLLLFLSHRKKKEELTLLFKAATIPAVTILDDNVNIFVFVVGVIIEHGQVLLSWVINLKPIIICVLFFIVVAVVSASVHVSIAMIVVTDIIATKPPLYFVVIIVTVLSLFFFFFFVFTGTIVATTTTTATIATVAATITFTFTAAAFAAFTGVVIAAGKVTVPDTSR